MEDKIIETNTYIKLVSKKKPSIDRIKTYLIKNTRWKQHVANKNLPHLLKDMCHKGLIELVDDAYKIKQIQERKLVKETLVELTSQCVPFSESEILVIPENLKSPE